MSAIPSWAVRGAKVAWVGEGMLNMHPVFQPANGDVFTISEVATGWDGGTIVIVAEMRNSDNIGPWWHVNRFRPLVSDNSEAEDLALFRHHLDQRQPEAA